MGSNGGRNYSFDSEELSQIQRRCVQLRKEKDMLRESQSQSFELIRRLEQHVKKLLEARADDKEQILKLERELSNCSQEIDYLQEQLNTRNNEVSCLRNHVEGLELKLKDMENLDDTADSLSEVLKRSSSENFLLRNKLANKEIELQRSRLRIEKLEEKLSLVKLECQCEVESMKYDLMSFEQSCFEADKIVESSSQENARINGMMIKHLEFQIKEAQNVIRCLDEENMKLTAKLDTSERNTGVFCEKMEHQFPEWMEKDAPSSSSELENYTSTCGEILGPLLFKLVTGRVPDEDLKGKMEKMSSQIDEYEICVRQLKEELREEKLKAKEEAEDLAQEMAELRYQITGLLDEESKRRACIEQISLQRIAKLEAQIEKEQQKSFNPTRHIRE